MTIIDDLPLRCSVASRAWGTNAKHIGNSLPDKSLTSEGGSLQSLRDQQAEPDSGKGYSDYGQLPGADKRKLIIADTPGLEQYTRDIATGAFVVVGRLTNATMGAVNQALHDRALLTFWTALLEHH